MRASHHSASQGGCGPGITRANSAWNASARRDDWPSNASALRRCRISCRASSPRLAAAVAPGGSDGGAGTASQPSPAPARSAEKAVE